MIRERTTVTAIGSSIYYRRSVATTLGCDMRALFSDHFYTLFWSAITLEGAHRVPDEVCDAEGAALAAAPLQEVGDGGAADLETIQDENSYTKISARQKKDSVPTEKLREE